MRQTEQAIAEADILVLVVDAQEGCVASDQEFHARLRTCGKPLLVAVNKVDGRDSHAAVAEFAELGAKRIVRNQRESGVRESWRCWILRSRLRRCRRIRIQTQAESGFR